MTPLSSFSQFPNRLFQPYIHLLKPTTSENSTSSYEEMEAPNFFSCIYTSHCLYPQTFFLLVPSTLQDQPFCLCSDQYPLRLTHGYFSISCMLSFSTTSSSSHSPTICKHVQASSTIFFFFKLKKHINRITKIFLTIVLVLLLSSS